jgi:Cu+-exporting ATPase
MHRELDHTESPFRPRSNGTLYLITAVLAALLVGDLWPQLAKWLTESVYPTPTWATTELFGFRFALLVAVLGGARVLYGSLEKLSEGRIGADLAIAVACIAAILIGQPLVAAEVVFIGLVGECLEAFTFDRTQRALGKLTELFPQRCWVMRDGAEVRVLTSAVVVGDKVVVKPGGRVPVDGLVMDGRSEVDSSALTGESLPVEKATGDTVLAGSIVRHGSLTIQALKIDKQTVAGKVIELTANALKTKSKGERQADRFARYFLPIVLGIALAVFLANVGYQYLGTQPEGKKFSLGAASRVAVYPALAVVR